MPIRIVDRAGRLLDMNASLADVVGDVTGTFVAAPARAGTVQTVLAPSVAAFVGQAAVAASFTGTVASTLSGFTGQFSQADTNSQLISIALGTYEADVPFTYSRPADPRPTTTVYVSTYSAFASAVAAGGNRVEVTASISGAPTSFGDDTDINFAPGTGLFLTGSMTIAQASRVRWQNGFIDGGAWARTFNAAECFDLLFNNVTFNQMYDMLTGLGPMVRSAFINCTATSRRYCIFHQQSDEDEDILVLKNDFYGGNEASGATGEESTVRIMNCQRALVVGNRLRNGQKHLQRFHYNTQYGYVAGNQLEVQDSTDQVVMWGNDAGSGSYYGPIGYLWFRDNRIYFGNGGSFVGELQVNSDTDGPVYVGDNTSYWDQGGSFSVGGGGSWVNEGGNVRITQSYNPPEYFGGANDSSNAARISTILAGRTPTVSYDVPADPVVSQVLNVTASDFTSLYNAVNTSGSRVYVPAGTYTGNLVFAASDVDVIFDSGAEVVGDFQIGGGGGAASRISRLRITGGNQSGGQLSLFHSNDVMVDDFYFNTEDGYNEMSGWSDGTDDGWSRVAFINTTIDHLGTSAAGGWAWFTSVGQVGATATDLFLMNLRMLTDGSQNNRFQSIVRMIVVDSSFNDDFGSANGMRTGPGNNGPCEDLWYDNVVVNEGWLMNYTGAQNVANGTFNRVYRYHDGSFFNFADMVGSNTGTISNSAGFGSTGTPPGSLSVSPFTDGGGNTTGNHAYLGSGVPSLPDGTLISAIGAVR